MTRRQCLGSQKTTQQTIVTKAPDTTPAEGIQVAAIEDPKALDHFTSTIAPCGAVRATAVLTIKHALLLLGFAVVTIALVRQLLAD